MEATRTYDKVSLLQLALKGLKEDELQEVADLTEFCTYPPNYILCHEAPAPAFQNQTS